MNMDIEKTVKLYYEDAYMREFDAAVVSCRECGDGAFETVLDRTAFFPEEGGQSPDGGTIGEGSVTDVQIKDDVIYHKTDRYIPEGENVHCALDFEKRFSNMQQHSGEHIFSGLVHKYFGYENVGFHLSDNEVTMDYSGPLTEEDIDRIEREANEAIYKNIESIQSFPGKEEAANTAYRSKKEIDGELRLITFPGYDCCACCAPHVAKTGEIGIIKIINFKNYKGGVRINMLAGMRALRYIENEHRVLRDTARMLTCGIPEFEDRVAAIQKEALELSKELAKAKGELLKIQLGSLDPDADNVYIFVEDVEGPNLRMAAELMAKEHAGVSGIFCGNDNEGYNYVLGSPDDARPLNEMLKEQLGAKGGGNSAMVQGSVKAERRDIERIFDSL